VGDWLTVQEVCGLFRLGERTVYEPCRTGQRAGAAKVGGQWRINRTKLTAWLGAGGEAGDRMRSGGSKE
jgi:excisionase family DNA binding protein